MKILILGGGPTGLGAAWRLTELGHDDWLICETKSNWGGLSASFQDDDGFVWDFGGHVLFSHYRYFDRVMDTLFKTSNGWLVHNREAWIWMQDRFVAYPLQNNIHFLPEQIYWECLEGIIDIQDRPVQNLPAHFGQWIQATFGAGLARWFMEPYNFKVWAYPPEQLAWSWVGERVAPVDLKQILKAAVFKNDNTRWGPNSTFRFPLHGGTGAIWEALASKLPPEKARLNQQAVKVDTRKKEVIFSDSRVENYDILLSTLPVTDFLKMTDLDDPGIPTGNLKYSSTHVVGLALKGNIPPDLASKCWIYFPENNCPFYRVTVFSNYSPHNVPDHHKYWSLMCEVSQSDVKPVDSSSVVEDVIRGALNTGLIKDRSIIDHTWHTVEKKAYPTPSVHRDKTLIPLLSLLEKKQIYSRGRFGAWKYEVGNMDHSFMQGVEFVNARLGHAEELTLWYPGVVNQLHPSGEKR